MAERPDFEAFALSKLKEAGHRITMPRQAVVRALARAGRPLTPNGIHAEVAAAGGKLDVVSVYRILSTLQTLGLVHHIGTVDAYSPCRLDEKHEHGCEHLICTSCGRVEELPVSQSSSDELEAQSGLAGFVVESIRVEVLGTCTDCLPRP
ncbi:MAG: transcriptional repressor [Fimbriimonadaceae bacterium]|nr:transcriptional repressor [Fimbriimonadaceae bacterium]